ncbi:YceI-like domain-containing protein [Mesonia phycicola]|uniref:YceI-like domain-containing protein n=1 Tax=Mesonia phycicola TaxID=579105 RepID=A0A1M6G757_9FLAO|nr:YceI family protein [Mesonia phycicola]SHJ05795.1 YceI-like domain-containing protein [Mesonia phycicola]
MRILIALAFCLTMQLVVAQEYKVVSNNSKVSVTGTSSLHDWECVVNTFEGNMSATVENNEIKQIENFNFQFKVKSLDSGKSSMNKNTYEALKEDKYPTITYKGSSVVINGGTATFTGTMTIAGTAKKFTSKAKINYSNGKITLSGSEEFKLTDFNIEPPTAVFGTIKTGDVVAIHYNIQLNK